MSRRCTSFRADLLTDTRAQRQSWIPFFDDVQAIIFLAPLLFNLTLEEDSRISRIVSTFPCPRFHDVLRILPLQEDSMSLWCTICGSRLLGGANLILFFNKVLGFCDLACSCSNGSCYADGYLASNAHGGYHSAEVHPGLCRPAEQYFERCAVYVPVSSLRDTHSDEAQYDRLQREIP